MLCVQRFREGLREIQLRNRGKWDEQLPHIFAIACEELRENKERICSLPAP